MTDAIKTYMYARTQQKLPPVDACTDAAALRAAGIDAVRLAII